MPDPKVEFLTYRAMIRLAFECLYINVYTASLINMSCTRDVNKLSLSRYILVGHQLRCIYFKLCQAMSPKSLKGKGVTA